MTVNSRVVLQDAHFAIAAHTDSLQTERFRISWLSIITLLRAVGHVLDKEDGASSPKMRAAVDRKWKELQQSKPTPPIFWGFIHSERNRFLKNYEHGIRRELIMAAPVIAGAQTEIRINVGDGGGGEIVTEAPFHSVISSGPFAGQREREVAWQAHDWWTSYLDEIDTLAK